MDSYSEDTEIIFAPPSVACADFRPTLIGSEEVEKDEKETGHFDSQLNDIDSRCRMKSPEGEICCDDECRNYTSCRLSESSRDVQNPCDRHQLRSQDDERTEPAQDGEQSPDSAVITEFQIIADG